MHFNKTIIRKFTGYTLFMSIAVAHVIFWSVFFRSEDLSTYLVGFILFTGSYYSMRDLVHAIRENRPMSEVFEKYKIGI